MAKTFPEGFMTAVTAERVILFYAVELFFDSGTLRFWTGIGNKTLGGAVYTGTGDLLGISGISEGGDMSAKNATITLNGVSSAFLNIALGEPYQGRIAKIYLGVEGVTELAECFTGFMDTMTIEDTGETSTISLNIESFLIILDRPVVRRYTNMSQRARYPNDTFFSFVAELQDKPIYWGRTPE